MKPIISVDVKGGFFILSRFYKLKNPHHDEIFITLTAEKNLFPICQEYHFSDGAVTQK